MRNVLILEAKAKISKGSSSWSGISAWSLGMWSSGWSAPSGCISQVVALWRFYTWHFGGVYNSAIVDRYFGACSDC